MARPNARSVHEAARAAVRNAGIAGTLHRVARWSVAASVGATACSSAFDHEDFVAPLCENGEWKPLAGLSPLETRDHLAAVGSGGDIGPHLIAEIGTRCADAADATMCEADFMAAWQSSPSPALVSTDGGMIETWPGAPAIARFLGEIDTPQEATLVAWGGGYDVRCGNTERSAVRPLGDGGYEVIGSRMTMSCDPVEVTRYLIRIGGDGSLRVIEHEVVSSEDGVCVGRRPVGLVRVRALRARGQDPIGAHLASIAHLEASAVVAFDVLGRELRALDAPAALLESIREARADEVRHARVMSRLARRRGGRPLAPHVVRRPLRDAFALALENAAEGCVRETFGAAVGLHQAARAQDPELREAMIAIAADEVRHAELSWRMDAWLSERLGDRERAAVRLAKRDAATVLSREVRSAVEPGVGRAAGLPAPLVASAMVRAMTQSVWS